MSEKRASSHTDLDAWRLADELRREVLKLMSGSRAAANQRFRTQGEEAAGSTCRNLAEGYKRFNPGEFATFARYAAASNAEVGDLLLDGLQRGYWTEERIADALRLVRRTGGAIGSLQRYLRSPQARRNAARILAAHSNPRTPRSPEPIEPIEPIEPVEPNVSKRDKPATPSG
jgi:four helix bundle protein